MEKKPFDFFKKQAKAVPKYVKADFSMDSVGTMEEENQSDESGKVDEEKRSQTLDETQTEKNKD